VLTSRDPAGASRAVLTALGVPLPDEPSEAGSPPAGKR
jgi:hypothetical protein